MTRQRIYGEDSAFGAWLREQHELDSHQASFTANDVDWVFHKYRANIDSQGTRMVQLLMWCEVKTHSANPENTQLETLYFHNQLLKTQGIRPSPLKKLGGTESISVRHFGVYVLKLSGESPLDSDIMHWGRIGGNGVLSWFAIPSVFYLKEILGFIRRPDNPKEKIDLRRHHKTESIVQWSPTPLGFPTERLLIKRS